MINDIKLQLDSIREDILLKCIVYSNRKKLKKYLDKYETYIQSIKPTKTNP